MGGGKVMSWALSSPYLTVFPPDPAARGFYQFCCDSASSSPTLYPTWSLRVHDPLHGRQQHIQSRNTQSLWRHRFSSKQGWLRAPSKVDKSEMHSVNCVGVLWIRLRRPRSFLLFLCIASIPSMPFFHTKIT